MAFDEDQKKCGGISTAGLITILLAVAMIVIGVINLDLDSDNPVDDGTCQIQVHIPVWLIGMGIILIGTMLLRFLFQRCCRKCNSDENKMCATLSFGCKFGCILIYDILATLVLLVWLIIGSKWTFEVYDDVVYDSNCPKYVYLFTFVSIIVLWVIFLFTVFFGLLAKFCQCFYDVLCCKPCSKSGSNSAV